MFIKFQGKEYWSLRYNKVQRYNVKSAKTDKTLVEVLRLYLCVPCYCVVRYNKKFNCIRALLILFIYIVPLVP